MSPAPRRAILLDRDGVLNRIVVDPEHGTINSPMHPSQVEVFPGVPAALASLTKAGYLLAIVTNQPAARQGKTTHENLVATHDLVLKQVQKLGGIISSSHICFHPKEDKCHCRKPATGMLEEAFAQNGPLAKEGSWIVGDGVMDVEAGKRFGVQTAFLGPQKCDACKVFSDRQMKPDFWAANLQDFVNFILSQK